MAEIGLIYSKEVESQLKVVYGQLAQTRDLVVEMNKMSVSFNAGKNASDPAAQKKAAEDYQRVLEKQEKQLERQRLAEIKLQQAREKAFDDYEKKLQREQQKLAASETMYNRIQASLNQLNVTYRDLALRKELGGTLTAKEEQQMARLKDRITQYDTALKAVDASMGKYQRDVGNYAGGVFGLQNSLNQITREMPAFANSVQTGFMAISNNLPIFFDAIQNTRNEIKALKSQGQEVPGLFSKLTSSLFSWGTALSVGVTLLTLFGPKLIDMITGSDTRKKALEAETEALNKKAQADDRAREVAAKYASDEISKAKILFENAKNQNLAYSERLSAVTELQKRYPDYLGRFQKSKFWQAIPLMLK